MGEALAESSFFAVHIKAFLEPSAPSTLRMDASALRLQLAASSITASRAASKAAGSAPCAPGTAAALLRRCAGGAGGGRSHIAPRDLAVFRAVLSASGLTPWELLELLLPSSPGFNLEADPLLVARAIAALAASGFTSPDIQLFTAVRQPALALTPAEVEAARGALLAAGFEEERLRDEVLREDSLGLAPGVCWQVIAQVAAVLAKAGFGTAQLCQVGVLRAALPCSAQPHTHSTADSPPTHPPARNMDVPLGI